MRPNHVEAVKGVHVNAFLCLWSLPYAHRAAAHADRPDISIIEDVCS